ncbi:hypothetical protein KKH23_02365 [Patescibacteria group bacterium]|nr:hypothetical protein [Patescibacteria group bacterium]MBU0776660.1 hypothetical protein [Patescibacteria group bacterium]MBU0846020.1 hypothetical protein [Patescibacteria group bacterium]MBU0922480.1 hypothetical protein [Patescibacteria group bacterium]MBU1066787.1 hypothetical protein [Patescibacteria group bacterium]
MSSKLMIYFFLFAGSIVGAYVPKIWGAGFLSISSLIFGSVGAIIGIIIGLKLTK